VGAGVEATEGASNEPIAGCEKELLIEAECPCWTKLDGGVG
jgi:hypothetical protein